MGRHCHCALCNASLLFVPHVTTASLYAAAMVLLKHLESGPQTTRVLINTSGAFGHVLAPL